MRYGIIRHSRSRDRLLEGEAAVAVGATASEAGVVE
jgi:hypothetical protein